MALVGAQIKHFKSALQCLGRIGVSRSLACYTCSLQRAATHPLIPPLLTLQGQSSSSKPCPRRYTSLR